MRKFKVCSINPFMIETDSTETEIPAFGRETPYEWYRTAHLKRINSVLTTLGLEGYDSDSFKELVDCQEKAFLERGFVGDDIKRESFLGVIASVVKEKGGGPAWLMMLSFAQSAYDDLSALEASGVAPGPFPKIS